MKIHETLGVVSINDLLSCSIDDFLTIEGFKIKRATNVWASIHAGITNVLLQDLMAASGIFGYSLGRKKFKVILDGIPDLLDVYGSIDNEDLAIRIGEIHGMSHATGSLITESLNEFKIFLEDNPEIVVVPNHRLSTAPSKGDTVIQGDFTLEGFTTFDVSDIESLILGETQSVSDIKSLILGETQSVSDVEHESSGITLKTLFTDKLFCFTGGKNSELETEIISRGGIVKSTVTKKTDYVVCKNISNSTKVKKGREVGAIIVTWKEMRELL